jgi:hypothetical protein
LVITSPHFRPIAKKIIGQCENSRPAKLTGLTRFSDYERDWSGQTASPPEVAFFLLATGASAQAVSQAGLCAYLVQIREQTCVRGNTSRLFWPNLFDKTIAL